MVDFILQSPESPAKLKHKTVGEYVWHKLSQLDNETVCLIEANNDQQLTVAELRQLSTTIALGLIGRGVKKGDIIAFYGQNSIQHTVLRFATYFLGLTFAPLSPTFGPHELREEVQAIGATVIISSGQELHKFDTILTNEQNSAIKLVFVFDGTHDTHPTYDQLLTDTSTDGTGLSTLSQIPYYDVNPDVDMFFLIYTSGSTGRPKCAKIPHQAMLYLCHEEDMFLSLDGTDRPIAALPFSYGHVSGAQILPLWVCLGATVVIYTNFTPSDAMASIEKYGITHFPCFPAFGPEFLTETAGARDLSSLRVIITGGAKFPTNIAMDIIEKYGVRFREVYVMTEYCLVTRGTPNDLHQQQFMARNQGPLSPGCEVRIACLTTGVSLGPDLDGEICVRGCKLFAGYYNNPSATAQAFDRDGWYRTGDIGHYDTQHCLYITDRIKDAIRVSAGGNLRNVSPVEVEQHLLTHPMVREAVVVGVTNTQGPDIQWPRAYVVPTQPGIDTADEIQEFVSGTLSYLKQLKAGVVFVDQIRRTVIGKVDRKYYKDLVRHELIE